VPAPRPTPPTRVTAVAPCTLVARGLSQDRGGHTVLAGISLTVGPEDCVGVIGPNGVGKSTLLQLLAGLLPPDAGRITLDPPTATVGYLAQEHETPAGMSVRQWLARRTGSAEAEAELAEAAAGLSAGGGAAERRYEVALERFGTLGVADLDARIDGLLEDLGVGAVLADQEVTTLSGGQRAKVALAGIELSRFDLTLLDEPTNDLDFEGLGRLASWVRSRQGGMVIVSHDRDFLERTVASVLELDPHSRTGQQFGGGWSGYLAERANTRRHATEAYERYERRRGQLEGRAERQRQWATTGVRKESRQPRDNDKAQRGFRVNRTEKLAAKARQTDRAREALTAVEKPWEGWDLRFSIEEASRAGAVVARLTGAVVERGAFRLGPLDLEIDWGERVALTGPNGAGKSTLVAALLGTLALSAGERWLGPSVVVGQLGQDRRVIGGPGGTGRADQVDLVRSTTDRCGITQSEARSLLAKFGLDAEHVTRPAGSLSPGERTRAELAVFQARGVNFLVLDEPTNHLDLTAIEQLEQALAGFGGTLLLVSHDRQLLGAVETTRSIELP
jgi:ATPase subunit of ABC transporter with duplicated ATPase domains